MDKDRVKDVDNVVNRRDVLKSRRSVGSTSKHLLTTEIEVGESNETTYYNTTQAESLERGMEKSVVAETKEEKSEARKKLKEQQVEKTREQLIEAEFAKIFQQGDEGTYVEDFRGNRQQQNQPLPKMHNVNVQRQMPQMPTIFQFEEGGIVGRPITLRQAYGLDPIYNI